MHSKMRIKANDMTYSLPRPMLQRSILKHQSSFESTLTLVQGTKVLHCHCQRWTTNQNITVNATAESQQQPFVIELLNPLDSEGNYSGTSNNTKLVNWLLTGGWAVTFGTARRDLGGLRPRPVPSSQYQM